MARKPRAVVAVEPESAQLDLQMPEPAPAIPAEAVLAATEAEPAAVEAAPDAATAKAAAAAPKRRLKLSQKVADVPAAAEPPTPAASEPAPATTESVPVEVAAVAAPPLPRLTLAPATAAAPTPTQAPSQPAVAPTLTQAPSQPAVAPTLTQAPSQPAVMADGDHAACVHRVHAVALGRKRDALQHLLLQTPDQPALIYTRTKHGADKIARVLERSGIKAAAIHGDKSQGARTRALAGFKSGELKALVITDIAARLLDFAGLPFVISYDLPHITEDYAQRVGRTGTAESTGLAITIITQEESPQFRAVRDQLRYPLELVPLPGFEAAEPFDPARDPVPRPGAETEGAEAPAAAPAPTPVAVEPRREGQGRGRRDRRGRHGRGEARPRDAAPATTDATAVVADESPEDAQPRSISHVRAARPERSGRKQRPERSQRGDRQPLEDRQPGFGQPQPVFHDDDDDGPGHGNSLAAPAPSQLAAGGPGRRRGRRDPFAVVVVDENRANIYDERQPDDYRDQWSVLGPDTNRPSWTYAEHQPQSLDAPPPRRPNPPPAGRRGPGSGPRGPQSGQPRGPQRHGRPRRAEGR